MRIHQASGALGHPAYPPLVCTGNILKSVSRGYARDLDTAEVMRPYRAQSKTLLGFAKWRTRGVSGSGSAVAGVRAGRPSFGRSSFQNGSLCSFPPAHSDEM